MSYDLAIMKAGASQANEPQPMGPQAEVRKIIESAFPQTVWEANGWAAIEGPGYSVELNLGEEDPITDLSVHLRGEFPDAMETLVNMAEENGWEVLDLQDGQY